MKVKKNKQPSTCRIMKELHQRISDIESNHDIKLTDKEVEHLKSMLCGYVCNGNCRVFYNSVLQ